MCSPRCAMRMKKATVRCRKPMRSGANTRLLSQARLALPHRHHWHGAMTHAGIIGTNWRGIKLQSIAMSERTICDLCGHSIPPHAHYVVRMDIFADPSMPEMDTH